MVSEGAIRFQGKVTFPIDKQTTLHYYIHVMSLETTLERLVAAIEANTAAIAANTTAGGAFLDTVKQTAPALPEGKVAAPAKQPPKKEKAAASSPPPAADPTPEPAPAADPGESAEEDIVAKRAGLTEFLRNALGASKDVDATRQMLMEVGEQFGVKGVKELPDDQLDAFREAVAARL